MLINHKTFFNSGGKIPAVALQVTKIARQVTQACQTVTPARPHLLTHWAENTTTTNLLLVLYQKMKGKETYKNLFIYAFSRIFCNQSQYYFILTLFS